MFLWSRRCARLVKILAVALLLAGCSSVGSLRPSPGLERIARSGELRVGMTGEQPPLNMTDRRGELFGLEVALARVLANSMNVNVRFVRLPFPELLSAVERGDVDIAMSGITITTERNRRVAFVGPYFVSGKSLLARKDALARVKRPVDLNSPSFRYVALQGSTSEIYARDHLPNATLVLVQSLEAAIAKLKADEVDALVADRETGYFAVLRHPDAGLRALPVKLTTEPIGIAVPPNDPLFANLLENYLHALERDGVLEDARNFWFDNPSWVKDLR